MRADRMAVLVSAVAACAAAPAWAQTAPSPPAAQDDEDPIIVRADRGDQVRIDRRTYSIRNDPAAQSTDMYDVLGRIPSVSVAPSGDVTLLGASGVTIQVNGQNVPGQSLEQVLRGLTGADVERIEVITNPSAQYSAAASGGIINIITRDRHDLGFTGNVSASVGSYGTSGANIGPNWSRGRWSFGGRLGHYDYHQPGDFRSTRTERATGSQTLDIGHIEQSYSGSGASVHATYAPSEKTKATLSLDSYSGDGDYHLSTDRTTDTLPIYRQALTFSSPYEFDRLGFNFQHDGAKPREQLRFNAAFTHNDSGSHTIVALAPVSGSDSSFFTRGAYQEDGVNAMLDYDMPFSGRRFLTAGLSIDDKNVDSNNQQQTLTGAPGPGDFQSKLTGRERTLAGYATYQLGGGDWTFLPGLRLEAYHREVNTLSGSRDDDTLQTFPSLHVQRTIGNALQLDVSYTRRIERRDLGELDPSVYYSDATHARSGNPNLRPTFTNAYEANLTYQAHGAVYTATFYDRINNDITSPFVTQNGDVTLSTTINAGQSEQRGLQVIARAPIGAHWRYSVTANAADSEFDVLRSGALQRQSALEYDGNATLEFRDPDQTAIGADDIQFDLRFQGPRHTLQQETDQFIFANMSWRRRFGRKLFGFVQVQDVFGSIRNESLTRADDFTERSVNANEGARFRLSLTYQLGAATDRPPEAPEGGGGPGPQ